MCVCVGGGRLFSEFFVAFLKTDFQDTRCILEKVSLDGMSNHEQVQPCIFMNSWFSFSWNKYFKTAKAKLNATYLHATHLHYGASHFLFNPSSCECPLHCELDVHSKTFSCFLTQQKKKCYNKENPFF